jgi:hypothetical protein
MSVSAGPARAPRLVDATGGLRWHMRAFARRRTLWAPFRAALAQWLEGWRPGVDRLLLVGPSAGWCLPPSALARFAHVAAVDIDPLAQTLFRLNHPALRARLSWRLGDFFADPACVLSEHAGCAILLCNVAGQRRFHHSDWRACEAEMRALRDALSNRPWASFHDLVSGPGSGALWPRAFEARPDGERLLRDYGLQGEWLDHLTADLLAPTAARMILPWRFKRDRIHLVEAGWNAP